MSASSDIVQNMILRIPYAGFLGVRMVFAGDEMTAVLPYSAHLIGNPTVPALHGGVIGAFLEMTALARLSLAQISSAQMASDQPAAGAAPIADGTVQPDGSRQARPIGVTVDYLRPGRPVDTFARADVKRIGRRIANVYVEAWQDTRAAPIAALHGRFLLMSQADLEGTTLPFPGPPS